MITLFCLEVASCRIVSVDIEESKSVDALRRMIKSEKPDELTLYLAKQGGNATGNWLSSVDEVDKTAIAALSSPEIPKEFRETYVKDELRLDPTFNIGGYFNSSRPGLKEIHVLMVMAPPSSKKRKSLDKNLSWSTS